MPGMDALFTKIESFEGMTVDYLSVSDVTSLALVLGKRGGVLLWCVAD
jgi:hypothetical protein